MKNKILLSYVITFISYLIINILLVSSYNTLFYTSVIINLLTFIISYFIINNVKKQFLNNYPITATITKYSILLIVLVLISTSISQILNINIVFLLIMLVIIYLVISILLLGLFGYKNHSKNINEKISKKYINLKELVIIYENLKNKCKNEKLYNEVLNLLKYSDCINEKKVELDEQISNEIHKLNSNNIIEDDDLENLKIMIENRNKYVKLNK